MLSLLNNMDLDNMKADARWMGSISRESRVGLPFYIISMPDGSLEEECLVGTAL